MNWAAASDPTTGWDCLMALILFAFFAVVLWILTRD